MGTYTTEGAVARDAANIIRSFTDWKSIETTEPDSDGYRSARGRFSSHDEVKKAMKFFTDGGINYITRELTDISEPYRNLWVIENALRQVIETR